MAYTCEVDDDGIVAVWHLSLEESWIPMTSSLPGEEGAQRTVGHLLLLLLRSCTIARE